MAKPQKRREMNIQHKPGFNPYAAVSEDHGMLLTIIRQPTRLETTLGDLHVNGLKYCETLEDEIRPDGVKVSGKTCIPAIRYNVDVTYSSRFKRLMPIIYTERDGVTIMHKGQKWVGCRFHGGNKHTHTEGCPLVAYKEVNETTIYQSAEKDLTELIMRNLGYDPVWNEAKKSWEKGPNQTKGDPVVLEIINPPRNNEKGII